MEGKSEKRDVGGLFERLVEIMDTLRGLDGCPWDREQTPQSLKPYLIEEGYEVLEAIDDGDAERYREELGDLLFQIIFHVRIAKERGVFDMGDVLKDISEKMVRRHPHVFGGEKVATSREVLANWEEIKSEERNNKHEGSVLSGVPRGLPALLKAQRLQTKTSRVGFDWERAEDVLGKVEEEMKEFKASLSASDRDRMEEEMGDLLFSLVNLSRLLLINPEDSLQKTNSKFVRRFNYIETRARAMGKALKDMSLAEMDALWDEAKGVIRSDLSTLDLFPRADEEA